MRVLLAASISLLFLSGIVSAQTISDRDWQEFQQFKQFQQSQQIQPAVRKNAAVSSRRSFPDSGAYISLAAGIQDISLQGAEASLGYGFSTGFRFSRRFSLGMYLTRSTQIQPGEGFESKHSFLPIGLEVNYFPSRVFLFGLKGGAVVQSAVIGGLGLSESDIEPAFGPKAGFDFPVGNVGISIGVEGSYLIVLAKGNGYQLLNMMPTMKYRF